ncbi:hypothetical protein DID80_04030 [Candidatus Marinamargulisbacteria bacterium SCGC AAA071-K20]|nr:hypothetical protein DID80_04030 [Candidatus Marinamargulisbacteria bacterium SCGC AAA071-K20]
MDRDAIITLLLLVACAIPVHTWFFWVRQQASQIEKQLEKEVFYCNFSKAPLLAGLCHGYNFLKGYAPIYIADTYFYFDDVSLMLIIVSSIALHIWSPLLGFKRNKHLFLPLLGVYVFMSPINIYIFPVVYLIASLLLNSFPLGLLSSIIIMFSTIWGFTLPIYLIPVNFILFIITALSLKNFIFSQLEDGRKWTIAKSFKNR